MIRSLRLLPYKGKWQYMFAEKLAMEELKNKMMTDRYSCNDDLIGTVNSTFYRYGLKPGFPAYSFIIKDLIQKGISQRIPPILNHLEETASFDISESLFVNIIRSYGDSFMLQEAIDLFFRIPNFQCSPSVKALNTLLSVLCKRREGLALVPEVLSRTTELKLRLEDSSFMILIKALCKNGRVGAAVELLEEMKLQKYVPHQRIYSMILSSVYKIEDFSMVISFFEQMKSAGVSLRAVDYNCVINALVKEGRADDAYGILSEMSSKVLRPSVGNYTVVLGGFMSSEDFQMAEEVFDEMLVKGLYPDSCTYSAYIEGLCKQGKVEEAWKMLICMKKMGIRPDSAICETIIRVCIQSDESDKARKIMKEMQEAGLIEKDSDKWVS
ncbi:pentatricopeptide repeat-containing protein At2g38420, mitochondrial-like [Wolffia australiana]